MKRGADLVDIMLVKLTQQSVHFNRSICAQYDQIVIKITTSAKTTDELVELEKYIEHLRSGALLQLKVGGEKEKKNFI